MFRSLLIALTLTSLAVGCDTGALDPGAIPADAGPVDAAAPGPLVMEVWGGLVFGSVSPRERESVTVELANRGVDPVTVQAVSVELIPEPLHPGAGPVDLRTPLAWWVSLRGDDGLPNRGDPVDGVALVDVQIQPRRHSEMTLTLFARGSGGAPEGELTVYTSHGEISIPIRSRERDPR